MEIRTFSKVLVLYFVGMKQRQFVKTPQHFTWPVLTGGAFLAGYIIYSIIIYGTILFKKRLWLNQYAKKQKKSARRGFQNRLLGVRFLPSIDAHETWPLADVCVIFNMVLEG